VTGPATPEDATPEDAELFADLARLLRRVDPVPSRSVAAADAAFAWIPGACEPAERLLERDTVALAGTVRAGDTVDATRTFRNRATSIRVAASDEPRGTVCLTGIVAPAGAEVAVLAPEGRRECVVDIAGRFAVTGLPRGPLRVVVLPGSGVRCATGWFVP
jgi:hypothetical protein